MLTESRLGRRTICCSLHAQACLCANHHSVIPTTFDRRAGSGHHHLRGAVQVVGGYDESAI